jgi:hypothetical protein
MTAPTLPVITFEDPLERPQLRRAVYGVLIALAVGNMVGRILAINSVDMVRLEQNLVDREVRSRLDKRMAEIGSQGTTLDKAAQQELESEIRDLVRDDPLFRRQRPFLSGNDRSRWNTIRALVEHGTYAIDDVIKEPNWDTLDMVKHQDSEGNWRMYSSKPPLLATLYAVPYWAVHKAAPLFAGEPEGDEAPTITLGTHPYEIGRSLLIFYNVVPMVIFFIVLGKLLDRFGTTDWGRIFTMAAATLGTFLTTYAVTLNNHLPGAVCAVITLWAASRIWYDGEQSPLYFTLAGLFAALTVACELPALSLLGLVGAALLWKYPRPTLMFGLPAAVVVLFAYFGTNYLAHGTFSMAYAHRGDGPQLFTSEVSNLENTINLLESGQVTSTLEDQFAQNDVALSTDVRVRPKTEQLDKEDPRRWVVEDRGYSTAYTLRVAEGPDDSGAGVLAVHKFDDWYDYEYTRHDGRTIPSYWREPKGIDKGEEDLGKYALHLLVGHHGIFSLTPVWLLIIPGLMILGQKQLGYGYAALSGMIAIVTLVCVAFYLLRPPLDRNYGGMTSGFRWVFWLAPLWLVGALPAADWASWQRWRRWLAYALLALSVVSVVYPTWNPWTYPWLTNFWLYMGWEQF